MFSDEDLEKLKSMTEDMNHWPPNAMKIKALIARLEATEKFALRAYATAKQSKTLVEAFDAWSKSAGL